jgi:DNA-binding XRE family transcriptional regulator
MLASMPTIDLASPLASLRSLAAPTQEELATRGRARLHLDGSGITQAEAARRRGVANPTQHQAEASGTRISLDVLLATAEALGLEIEIRATRKKVVDRS